MRVPIITQIRPTDNGVAALAQILGYYGRFVSLQDMRKDCPTSRDGVKVEQIINTAEHYGLEAEAKKVDADSLKHLPMPYIACWKRKYYAIVLKISGDKIYLSDPAKGKYSMKLDAFLEKFGGTVVLAKPGKQFVKAGKRENSMSMLYKRIMGYRFSIIMLLIMSAVITNVNLSFLRLQQYVIDEIFTTSDTFLLGSASAAMIFFWLVVFVAKMINEIQTYRVSRKMIANSGADIFKALLHLPMSYFEKNNRGELMTRIEQNKALNTVIINSFVPKVLVAISLISYLIMIFTYNKSLSIVLLAVVAVLSIVVFLLQKYSVMLTRSTISSEEQARNMMLNGLNNINTIKVSGTETRIFHYWRKTELDYLNSSNKIIVVDAVLNVLQNVQNTLTSAIMLFFGAFLIIKGAFTIGSLALFQAAFASITSSFSSIMNTAKQVQNARTTMERIDDIVLQECEEDIPLPEEGELEKLSGKVEIAHLTYRYNKGDAPAITDITFTIEPGEMVALVGGSGCGKSTLMKLISGQYQVQEGSITYDGKVRSEIPDIIFHSSLSCVAQDSMVFDGTIRENITMWDQTIEEYEMILAARDAQIHNRIMKNMNGYEAMIDDGGQSYSGGELQRMELARALSQEGNLMLLDEFTSALDARLEQKVFQAIRDKGVTCLIAAHRFSTIMECDKIIVMDKGNIIEMGTSEELLALKGKFYELVIMQ